MRAGYKQAALLFISEDGYGEITGAQELCKNTAAPGRHSGIVAGPAQSPPDVQALSTCLAGGHERLYILR